MTQFEAIKQGYLEDRLQLLHDKFKAVGAQHNLAFSEAEGVVLKHNLDAIEKEVKEIEKEIADLKSGSPSSDASKSGTAKKSILERIKNSETALNAIENKLNPYKGLEPFTEKDADYFFGREDDINRLIEKINTSSHVMVTGSSGSGKSSLMMAGVLPRLRQNGWLVTSMTAGTDPNWVLVRHLREFSQSSDAIVQKYGGNNDVVEKMEKEDGAGTLRAIISELAEKESSSKIVLYIDQFESLFANQAQQDTNQGIATKTLAFLDNLWVASQNGKIRLVISLRPEFISQLLKTHNKLGKAFQENNVVIESMSVDDLRLAIEQPAQCFDVKVEDYVIDEIINEVKGHSGRLPLLSFTMKRLWAERLGEKKRITREDYQDFGGIKDAISKEADREFAQIAKLTRPKAVDRVLVRLISSIQTSKDEPFKHIRRTVTQSELLPDEWDLVEELAKCRLVIIRTIEDKGVITAELVHDALIENWQKLNEFAQTRGEFTFWRDYKLSPMFNQWLNDGEPKGLLLKGADLALAQLQSENEANEGLLNSEEQEFIQKSLREQSKERRVNKVVTISVIALIIGIVFFAALARTTQEARNRAEQAQQVTESAKNELATRVIEEESAKATAVWAGALAATREKEAQIAAEQAAVAEDAARQAQATAETDRQFADQQSRLAESRAIAAVALRYATLDPDICFHLALNAIDTTRIVDNIVTSEAENALQQCVQMSYSQFSIVAHTSWVNTLAVSPDGILLATGGQDNVAKLWDLSTGQELFVTLPFNGPVFDIAFSPDGTQIAAASADWTTRIWDVKTGAQLAQLSGSHSGSVNTVAYSPDGSLLATAGEDKVIILWNLSGSTPMPDQNTLKGHTDLVNSIAFSLDGQRLLSGSGDKTAILWDVATRKPLMTLQGHTGPIRYVAIGPDTQVATASWDGTARIWDTETGMSLTLVGHDGAVNAVAFNPNGLSVVTAGSDGTIRLWDTNTGQLLKTLSGHSGSVNDIEFTKDGLRLISASDDRTVRLWESEEPLELTGYKGLLNGDGSRLLTLQSDSDAVLWDMSNGLKLLSFSYTNSRLINIAYSVTSEKAATAYEDGTVLIWNTQDGNAISQLSIGSSLANAIVFSPDSSRLYTANKVSSGNPATLSIWSSSNGQLLQTLSTYPTDVNHLATNANGDRLAVALASGSIEIWDLVNGNQMTTLTADPTACLYVAFAPDGNSLAAAYEDGNAVIWDLMTNTPFFALSGHTGAIHAINFDSSGRRLVTGGFDKTVRTWSVETGKKLLELPVPGGIINDAMFTPDGSRLLLTTSSGDVQTVILNIDELIDFAKSRITRPMTIQECRDLLQRETCP